MKLLVASAGITNPSIQAALVDLLDKPIADSTGRRDETPSNAFSSQ